MNTKALELWGGHECTVNRVGEHYSDQTVLSGHQSRLTDLDLFAGLGIRVLRYPILWERIAPNRPDELDWAWTDERLDRIKALGMGVVGGLVHHGSGPRYTNLLDDSFAPGLAKFSRAAAERYPDVRDWTPINEPLTTARFSALYGHWYPHETSERAFWLALLNQIDAIRLAMREIRRVNPAARLIQTEDLGRTYATGPARTQGEYDNQRRWMTWDLLCGRVTREHPLWDRLVRFGLSRRLALIADDPCPPSVIGVNHYVTSDRFLDHRWWDYPQNVVGGNETSRFADVDAVRAILPGPGGLEGALSEAWARYGLTLAVTESHLNCTRENQVYWLTEAWRMVNRLKSAGVDIEAMTVWSLLGAHDWNSLLTRAEGHYESGAFDVRSGQPRPTAIAEAVRSLTDTKPRQNHLAHEGVGWWRRDIRLVHRPFFRSGQDSEPPAASPDRPAGGPPLLITGATGALGKALARACDWRGLGYVLTDRATLSLGDAGSIATALDRHKPWAVINAAGWAAIDAAETAPARCLGANADGCENLASACATRDIPLVSFSSDMVFDGRKRAPYDERDLVNPLNVYGESQAAAEAAVAALGGKCLTVRTAALFSPFDHHNFAAVVERNLRVGERIQVAQDLTISPTYLPDLTDAVLDLLIDGETGLWHLCNPGAVTWAAFAAKLAEALGLEQSGLRPRPWRALGWTAERPVAAALTSRRGVMLPSLDDAIGRYAEAIRSNHAPSKGEPTPTPHRKPHLIPIINAKPVRADATPRLG